MNANTFWLALVAGLIALAPLAAAQEESPEKQDGEVRDGGQAWVDNCPPDMMCAFEAEEPKEENVTRGPADGSCEYCRGGSADEPVANGSEEPDYIDGSNCMDGQQEGEDCRDDVYYMTPPKQDDAAPEEDNVVKTPEGAEGGITSVKEDDAAAGKKTVPAVGLLAGVGAVAAIAILVAGRRD